MATLTEIIVTERKLNSLLPGQRLEQTPPGALINAARAWSGEVWKAASKLGPMPVSGEQLLQARELANKPVYVCGVHHSGTTLVRDLLDGHPELTVLPSEGTWYTNLEHKLQLLPEDKRLAFLGREWLRRLANPINQPPYWLLGRSNVTDSPYVD